MWFSLTKEQNNGEKNLRFKGNTRYHASLNELLVLANM